MAYTPNPFETTQPTTDKFVETAAAEFRALKAVVNNLYAASNYVGNWASLTGALAAGKTVTHAGTIWFLLTALANVTTSEPGVSADWLNIGNVRRTGDTMTGPLEVPAGASGTQVGRVQEVSPPGLVAFFCRSTAPTGWLKANGALVSRTTYADLFAAIGTTFGAGDGSTTFALPDMRGEFPRGWDDGRGVDSGRAFGSAQAATRVFNGSQDDGGWGGRQIDANIGAGADFDSSETVSAGVSTASYATSGPAITNPTQNRIRVRPRNIAVLACIKF